jgi:hypothetical protein
MGRRSGGARRRSADASARRRIRAARSGSDFEVGGGSGEPPGRRGEEGEWRRLHARVSRRHLTRSWGWRAVPPDPAALRASGEWGQQTRGAVVSVEDWNPKSAIIR